MKFMRFINILLALFITGCAGMGPMVATNTTAFYLEDYSPNGSITVMSADREREGSPEFNFYKVKVEEKLKAQGYIIEPNGPDADYIAFVGYGIDEGTTKTGSYSTWGQTGGGTTTYTSGTISTPGSANTVYSGTSTTAPTYGVTGSKSYSYTRFKRVIELTILDQESLAQGKEQIIYQSKTMSEGSCNVIVEVFDEMLEAMFTDFITKNGQNRKLEVPGNFDC
jgi:hypothetical protein